MVNSSSRRALALSCAALLGLLALTGLFAVRPVPAQAAASPALGIAAGGTLQFETTSQQEAYLTAARKLGASWLSE